ncbi:hypothetical protein MHYP_G00002330 [Metynnis hypsauchen]
MDAEEAEQATRTHLPKDTRYEEFTQVTTGSALTSKSHPVICTSVRHFWEAELRNDQNCTTLMPHNLP